MKCNAWEKVSRYRIKNGVMGSTDDLKNNGAFFIPTPLGDVLKVVVSDQLDWDHVSVSCQTRVPDWYEMVYIKNIFFDWEETAMQLHPPHEVYINQNANVLHMWRPHKKTIPMPPLFMV